MAPRRGGGSSSSSGSSISSCPDAFQTIRSQVAFAYTVTFLAIFLGITVALCCVRKRSGGGKRLIAWPYSVALFFINVQNILDLIGAVMIQCDTLDSSTYYNMQIASNIFYQLGTWGLFSVVIYVLNSLLRTHRDGSKMLFKGIPLAIVAAMFVITAGYVGLASYNTWTQIDGGYYAWGPGLYGHQAKLQLARSILYLLGLIASGVLSMMSIFAMRSRGLPGGDLIGWVIALYISMMIWMIISVVFAAQYFNYDSYGWHSKMAMSYVNGFFHALSFIILLCIAKHVSWSKPTATTPQEYAPVMQQQTAYGGYPTNGQHEYYQQAPVYVQPK